MRGNITKGNRHLLTTSLSAKTQMTVTAETVRRGQTGDDMLGE
jgi:hypothetical protein